MHVLNCFDFYFEISFNDFFRCKCNGHANKCDTFQDNNFEEKYKCDCQHNTDGIDCEKCAPFFNDRPWAAATFNEANECIRKLI